jgi:hypothetical protein
MLDPLMQLENDFLRIIEKSDWGGPAAERHEPYLSNWAVIPPNVRNTDRFLLAPGELIFHWAIQESKHDKSHVRFLCSPLPWFRHSGETCRQRNSYWRFPQHKGIN